MGRQNAFFSRFV